VAAQVARSRGDLAQSRARLVEAIRVVRVLQERIDREALGFSYWESVQDLFDEAIRQSVRNGDPNAALSLLEEARDLAGPPTGLPTFERCRPDSERGPERSVKPTWKPARERSAEAGPRPSDDPTAPVVLAFGSLGDETVWWLLDGESCRFGAADGEAVRRGIDEVLAAAETRGGAPEALELLYRELLARPLRAVAPGRPLVLVPDRELLRVPFASLRNPETGRPLIRERALSLRTRVRDAFADSPVPPDRRGWSRPGPRALVVGDPAFDRAAVPLVRLPGALREAQRVAALYGAGSVLLSGERATAANVRAELPTRSVLHLAMHTVPGPGGSGQALLLAPEPGSGRSGMVASDDLLAEAAGSLDLVVLSGCSTLGTTVSRSGGLVGLARPFLARGARAVTGTLWPVDDAVLTSLMTRFHAGVLDGLSASEALRRAQRETLERRPDPADPAAGMDWAAVQLIGDLPGAPSELRTPRQPRQGDDP
jgi:hypothetical protein